MVIHNQIFRIQILSVSGVGISTLSKILTAHIPESEEIYSLTNNLFLRYFKSTII
jgi:hypothetical protein